MIPRLHTRKKLANRCALAGALLLVAATGPARAQDPIGTTWIGNGGVWGNAFNWECVLGGPLGRCLPNNGPLHSWGVLIGRGQLCNLNISPTIDIIQMFDTTTLNQFNGFTLTIVGVQNPPDPLRPTGVFSLDDATYIMSSTGNNTNLVFIDGPLFLEADSIDTGLIQMSNDIHNRIYAATANEILVIGDHITIEGSGQIGKNQTTIINDGIIRATQTEPLILDPGPGGFTNNAFLLADSGGTLRFDAGNFDNTNGAISAVGAGSTVMLNGGTITGGFVQAQHGTFQLNGGTIQNTTLVIGDGASGLVSRTTTVGNITNFRLGVINHNNGVGLRLSGTFTNHGSYFMNSTGFNTDLILEADTTIIGQTGGLGEIDMSAFRDNRIYGSVGGERLTNIGHRIHGAGQIGRGRMALTNFGIIEADENGVRLTIDMAGDASLNNGVFRASSGGILSVSTDTFDQSPGGLVEALDGSLVELIDSTMIGGTFNTVGTGVIRVTRALLDGSANTGLIEIPNETGLFLRTSLANHGTIKMLSSGQFTNLILDTDVRLTGFGTINMTNNLSNRIRSLSNPFTFTNVNNTIRGSGSIGRNDITVVNQGTIIADQPTRLQIDPGAGGFDNQGSLRAENGAELRLNPDPFTTSGSVFAAAGSTIFRVSTDYTQTAGSTIIHGSLNMNVFGLVTLNGGILGGSGTVNADVSNIAGIAAPGGSAGTLTVNADYTQGTGGSLDVELGGLIGGTEHDVLVVTGTATLAGRLEVHLINSFVPQIGQSFQVLTAGAVSGVFDEVVLFGFPAGLRVDVTYNADSIVLQVNSRLTPSPGEEVRPLSIRRIPQP